MIHPDIIVSWPRNADYPLWRQFIRDERQRFNEIIIVFTETNQGHDYREFVTQAMMRDYVHFVQSPPIQYGLEDWRNIAIHAGLLHSYNAEWIWFTEQDFYPVDKTFWEDVEQAERDGFEVIGVLDSERLHPCCMFIKRSVLEKTGKNFGIVKDTLDHFGLIQKSIKEQGIKTGIISTDKYVHMAGLSHNMYLLGLGEAPNHQKEDFLRWLKSSLCVKVPIDSRFRELAEAGLAKFGA